MIGGFFRPDQAPDELLIGILPRRGDKDKLAYKAFILGRQLAALEKERASFYKEQAQSAQQMNQMLMLLMNLKAQGAMPPMQLPPEAPPIPGAPTGIGGAPAVPPSGPIPQGAAGPGGALPVPGTMPPQELGFQPV